MRDGHAAAFAPANEASYHSWDEILSHPQPITIRSYSTGMMTTLLSGIRNLEHSQAQDIEDELVQYPVNVNLIQHQELGSYLIDAGLDASCVYNPPGGRAARLAWLAERGAKSANAIACGQSFASDQEK